MDAAIAHHAALVLAALYAAVALGFTHPAFFFLGIIYLYAVNECYNVRLRRRLQFEERKIANQRRLLSDVETVRWLNNAVEKIWPICMEKVATEKFLLPIIPWFLDKFKPWTAKKVVMQDLYLGSTPPMFTDIRVIRESSDDDHMVLEVGMNFLSADDMNATLAVQLRKRVGFGITLNMHMTGMHIEGKVLVGVKFLQHWPFIARIRMCFVEPPYCQVKVKPIVPHGVDVSEIPGVSGFIEKLLDVAFGQTLVEPNMLVVDVVKFAAQPEDGWFSVDEKSPIAYAKIEILEGAEMKPADLNGLADPYVKGQLGPYGFQTKIRRRTLNPKWAEEYKIPIASWEAPNNLTLQVHDKDHLFDDFLGDCSVNINDFKDGQRYDMWLSLKNVKTGRIHIAVTILDELEKDAGHSNGPQSDSRLSEDDEAGGPSDGLRKRMVDEFEPVNIEGTETVGVWVQRPANGGTSHAFEHRKGRPRQPESLVRREKDGCKESNISSSEILESDAADEKYKKHPHLKEIKRGFEKLGSAIHASPRNGADEEPFQSPAQHANLRPVGDKRVTIEVMSGDDLTDDSRTDVQSSCCDDDGEQHSFGRQHMRGVARRTGKAARVLKSMLSGKRLARKDGTQNDA